MSYDPKCWNCVYLNPEKKYKPLFGNETYYCEKNRNYVNRDQSACNSFKDKTKKSTDYKPSGCFITTIVCEILGFDNNSFVLNSMRKLRDEYMINHLYCLPLLVQYDNIGPVISSNIKGLEFFERKELAKSVYERFLVPCIAYISINKYEEAISCYINMIDDLTEKLSIAKVQTNAEIPNFKDLGHARVRSL